MNTPNLLKANLILSSIIILFIFSSFFKGGVGNKIIGNTFHITSDSLSQVVHSVDLNQDYFLAGEYIPTHIQEVRERLDREIISNSYRHSRTLLNMKRAAKLFPIIEPILLALKEFGSS